MDISGNRNEVFGHRRCPNLLKMTKKVPFSAGTRRQDRFPSDFKPFFAVSAKAPAGKQRSACGDLDNVSFRRYFCLTVGYRGSKPFSRGFLCSIPILRVILVRIDIFFVCLLSLSENSFMKIQRGWVKCAMTFY